MKSPLAWIFPGSSKTADLLWLVGFFGLLLLPLLTKNFHQQFISFAFGLGAIYCFLVAYYINKYKKFNGFVERHYYRRMAESLIRGLAQKYPLKSTPENYKNHVHSMLLNGIVLMIVSVIIFFFPFAS